MTKGIAKLGLVHRAAEASEAAAILRYTQAKVIGGGSSINAQIYTRGNAQRLRCLGRRKRAARAGAIAEVLPYFKRAEDNDRFVNEYHGYGGPIGVSVPINPLPISEAFIRAAQEYGIPFNADFNGAQQAGIGHYQVTVRKGRRSSAATAYLKPARGAPESDGHDRLAAVTDHRRARPRSGRPGRRRPSGLATVRAAARGHRFQRRHRFAAPAPALRHRPGGCTAHGWRRCRPRPARRGQQHAGPPRPLRHRRMHGAAYL